jgi:hypothetical protein
LAGNIEQENAGLDFEQGRFFRKKRLFHAAGFFVFREFNWMQPEQRRKGPWKKANTNPEKKTWLSPEDHL